MVAELRIEAQEWWSLGHNLTCVATEFEAAPARSESIAAAVGPPGLADVVRDFASTWQVTRSRMVDSLQALAAAAAAVGAVGDAPGDTEGSDS
jgi:hypothetical protein